MALFNSVGNYLRYGRFESDEERQRRLAAERARLFQGTRTQAVARKRGVDIINEPSAGRRLQAVATPNTPGAQQRLREQMEEPRAPKIPLQTIGGALSRALGKVTTPEFAIQKAMQDRQRARTDELLAGTRTERLLGPSIYAEDPISDASIRLGESDLAEVLRQFGFTSSGKHLARDLDVLRAVGGIRGTVLPRGATGVFYNNKAVGGRRNEIFLADENVRVALHEVLHASFVRKNAAAKRAFAEMLEKELHPNGKRILLNRLKDWEKLYGIKINKVTDLPPQALNEAFADLPNILGREMPEKVKQYYATLFDPNARTYKEIATRIGYDNPKQFPGSPELTLGLPHSVQAAIQGYPEASRRELAKEARVPGGEGGTINIPNLNKLFNIPSTVGGLVGKVISKVPGAVRTAAGALTKPLQAKDVQSEIQAQEERISEQITGKKQDLGRTMAEVNAAVRRGQISKEQGRKVIREIGAIQQRLAEARPGAEDLRPTVAPDAIIALAREATTRGGARIVNEALDAMGSDVRISPGERQDINNKVARALLGNKPLGTAREDVAELTGNRLSGGPLASAAGVFINLPGLGGLTKKVGFAPKAIKGLAKLDDTTDILRVLDANPTFRRLDDATKTRLTQELSVAKSVPEVNRVLQDVTGIPVRGAKAAATDSQTLESIRGSNLIPDSVREVANDLEVSFGVKRNKPVVDRARERISANPQAALRYGIENATDEGTSTLIELLKANPNNDEIVQQVVGTLAERGTAQGRAVQILSTIDRFDPEGVLVFAERRLKRAGGTLTAADRTQLRTLAEDLQKMPEGEAKDFARAQVMYEVARMTPASFGTKAATLWKAGLLTSARTHMRNLLSTATNTSAEIMSGAFAAGIDAIISGVRRTPRTKSITLRGLVSGAKQGLTRGGKILRTGIDPTQGILKFDLKQIKYSDTVPGRIAQGYTDTVYRLLQAEDQLFYQVAYKNSLQEQAKVRAINEGVRGADRRAFIDNLVDSPDPDMLTNAALDAARSTFRNNTGLARRINQAKGATPWSDFLVPFSTTPSAVVNQMLAYTPVGFTKQGWNVVKKIASKQSITSNDRRALVQAMGRSTTGTAISAIGYTLYKNGNMTLGRPTSQAEREQWDKEGKQPWSIKVNGEWLSIANFGAIEQAQFLGGLVAKAQEDGKNSIVEASKEFFQRIQQASPTEGFVRFGTLFDDSSSIQAFASNLLGSIVPAVVGDIARATDVGPGGRTVDRENRASEVGILGGLRARIPGVRMGLPSRNLPSGEPLEGSSPLEALFSPFGPRKANDVADAEQTRRTKIGELEITTKETDDFPWPDYSVSTPGQILRGDLKFQGKGKAEIVMHLKSPSGEVINVPQTQENYQGGKNDYGTEVKIPSNAETGAWEVWASVNGQELNGTRVEHQVVKGKPVNRYEVFDQRGRIIRKVNRSGPTFTPGRLEKSNLTKGATPEQQAVELLMGDTPGSQAKIKDLFSKSREDRFESFLAPEERELSKLSPSGRLERLGQADESTRKRLGKLFDLSTGEYNQNGGKYKAIRTLIGETGKNIVNLKIPDNAKKILIRGEAMTDEGREALIRKSKFDKGRLSSTPLTKDVTDLSKEFEKKYKFKFKPSFALAETYAKWQQKVQEGLSPVKKREAERDFLRYAFDTQYAPIVNELPDSRSGVEELLDAKTVNVDDVFAAFEKDERMVEAGLRKQRRYSLTFKSEMGYQGYSSSGGGGRGYARGGRGGRSRATGDSYGTAPIIRNRISSLQPLSDVEARKINIPDFLRMVSAGAPSRSTVRFPSGSNRPPTFAQPRREYR